MSPLVQCLVAPGVSLCPGAGFSFCYHIIYSSAKSSEAFSLFFLKYYYGDVLKSLMEDVTSGMASGKES